MFRKLLILPLLLFSLFACNSDTNARDEKQKEQVQKEEQTTTEFKIVGKWILYEDFDRRGLNNEEGTFIFQDNGVVIMVKDVKNQKKAKYEFSQEFKTLSIEGEMVDIEIEDNNNVLLKGKNSSGNKFVSKLVRQ
jgi:hypothetical protein